MVEKEIDLFWFWSKREWIFFGFVRKGDWPQRKGYDFARKRLCSLKHYYRTTISIFYKDTPYDDHFSIGIRLVAHKNKFKIFFFSKSTNYNYLFTYTFIVLAKTTLSQAFEIQSFNTEIYSVDFCCVLNRLEIKYYTQPVEIA